jgi:putative aldouronate transport system permease protein
MMTQVLKLTDSVWALIVPSLVSTFNIFVVRNYIKTSIPLELFESAKIDGASEMTTFIKVIVPLLKPVTATVGLFIALGYWNDWFMSNLFITTTSKYSLQYYLYSMLNSTRVLQELKAMIGDVSIDIDIPTETTKLAMAVVSTGPILFLYPFVQRYFVTGLVIGSIKG